MRAIMLLVGTIAAFVVVGAIWIDEGEVVTLTTLDADAAAHATQLWVAELDGEGQVNLSPDSE